MTTHDALPAAVLQRKAVVYVRQSTPQQVQSNLESQRRQYELVEVARRRGFTNIDVIDDDLGRTASGSVERPGFDRLVAALCAGQVGAVLCLEASRLARNGVTGTICLSCADWWRPVSSTLMAYTTRAGRTIACCSV
jgi:DNA invertase Pin-like site-specific DNA recombinase